MKHTFVDTQAANHQARWYLLIDLADLLVGAEDELHCATARCPDDLLYRPDHTDVWDIL